MNLSDIEDTKLIHLYGELIVEMKKRKIIRTKNIVGEVGEYLAINYYNKTHGLPKLQESPISTKSIDAISNKGQRYTIKTITGKTTGVFYGLNAPNEEVLQEQLFEYLIIISLNEEYDLKQIIELTWEQFLKYKKWHSRMNAWNISINRELLSEARIIYDISIN